MKILMLVALVLMSAGHTQIKDNTYRCSDGHQSMLLTFLEGVVYVDGENGLRYVLLKREKYYALKLFAPAHGEWVIFPYKLIVEGKELVEITTQDQSAFCETVIY